ncbi:MAG: hypothetical protein ACP5UN_02440 [Candidatus Micrarchaeia archaeon]
MFKAKKIAGLISLLFFLFIFIFTLAYPNTVFNGVNNTDIVNLSNQSNSNITFNINLKETLAIINKVNNSAYIIFYPNLSSSYKYLQEAKNESLKNITDALVLLNKSKEDALLQEKTLNKNKAIAFIITLILTVITLIILYFIIMPNKTIRSK